jgi:hypothetical protein
MTTELTPKNYGMSRWTRSHGEHSVTTWSTGRTRVASSIVMHEGAEHYQLVITSGSKLHGHSKQNVFRAFGFEGREIVNKPGRVVCVMPVRKEVAAE